MRCKQWGEGSLEESTESVLEGNDAAPSGNVRVVVERSQLVGECDILFRCSLPRVDLVCEKAKAVRITGVRKGVEGDRYPRCKESPQDDRDDVHADLLVNLARFAKGERTDELVGNVARTAGRGVVPDRVWVVGDDRNERHLVERCELASSRPETSALAVDDDKAVAVCHGTVCDAKDGARLAALRSNLLASEGWSMVSEYLLPGGIACCSHPLASRMDSGSAGATKSVLNPEWLAIDSAAALLASTTPTGHRPPAARVARSKSTGASSFGQSSSLSMTISTTPGERSPLPARSTALSNSPSNTSLLLVTLNGRTSAYTSGFTNFTRRFSNTGAALKFP